MRQHDVAQLVSISERPYYFDREILISRESIAEKYRELLTAKPSVLQDVQINSIRARTVSEMKREGPHLRRDRIFNSLSLDDSDWGIEVRLPMGDRSEGMIMFAGVVAGRLRIVGMWDS